MRNNKNQPNHAKVLVWCQPDGKAALVKHHLRFYYFVSQTQPFNRHSGYKIKKDMLVVLTPRPRGC